MNAQRRNERGISISNRRGNRRFEVAQDSVPITTERSFSAESFSFKAERPFVLRLTAKDFKENDTGLEHIGTRIQQMGDGGLILQIKDADGQTVVVSNADWACLPIHQAPAQKSWEDESYTGAGVFTSIDAPQGWGTADFDASDWPAATEHSESKDNYDKISWDQSAQLIRGANLQTDNTLPCRLTVE